MIGFYNYTVWLTYAGFCSALFGIMQLFNGKLTIAIICLLISGGCDMFDGIVARTKKNRTRIEQNFGVQIDSLSDAVCFGVLPAMFNYTISKCYDFSFAAVIISIYFALAGLIRLGYFNVTEEERQKETSEKRKEYQGLPITSSSIFIPIVYLFKPLAGEYFYIISNIALLIIGTLFITNFKLKKPGKTGIILMLIFGIIMLSVLIFKIFM